MIRKEKVTYKKTIPIPKKAPITHKETVAAASINGKKITLTPKSDKCSARYAHLQQKCNKTDLKTRRDNLKVKKQTELLGDSSYRNAENKLRLLVAEWKNEHNKVA